MKALRFTRGELKLAEVDRPAIAGEALVRVIKSGICNTDVEIVRGYAGFEGTLGHEFVGIVEASADRPDLVGKRVVGEINAGCGTCERCSKGDPRHCPTRTVLGIKGRDGAHAEFLTLPSRNLIEVPAGVPDHQAVFVEPLAAAYGITEQVEVGPETSVAVIGDGKLGLLCAFAMSLRTKNLIIVGKHEEKLELAEISRDRSRLAADDRKIRARVRCRYRGERIGVRICDGARHGEAAREDRAEVDLQRETTVASLARGCRRDNDSRVTMRPI